MLRLSLILLLLFAVLEAGAKGRIWSYVLTGTAYNKATKDVLRHATIMINEHVVTTDSTGHYEVTISGVTCDRGSGWQIRRCNEKAYGDLVIRRALSTRSATVPSHWKRYAFCESGIAPCNIQRRDLFVP